MKNFKKVVMDQERNLSLRKESLVHTRKQKLSIDRKHPKQDTNARRPALGYGYDVRLGDSVVLHGWAEWE